MTPSRYFPDPSSVLTWSLFGTFTCSSEKSIKASPGSGNILTININDYCHSPTKHSIERHQNRATRSKNTTKCAKSTTKCGTALAPGRKGARPEQKVEVSHSTTYTPIMRALARGKSTRRGAVGETESRQVKMYPKANAGYMCGVESVKISTAREDLFRGRRVLSFLTSWKGVSFVHPSTSQENRCK